MFIVAVCEDAYVMKKNALILMVMLAATGCGTGDDVTTRPAGSMPPDEGNFDRTERAGVNEDLALEGYEIAMAKCSGCHSVGSEGQATTFVGLTDRRDDQWITDFLQGHDMAPDGPKDEPLGREDCAVRAPGGELDEDEARRVLHYMHTL